MQANQNMARYKSLLFRGPLDDSDHLTLRLQPECMSETREVAFGEAGPSTVRP